MHCRLQYAREISVGKEREKMQDQKTRTEEKEIKVGKRQQQATGWLLTAHRTGFKEQTSRSGTGLVARHHWILTYTHTFPMSSSLMFTVSINQHFIVTGAT